MWRSHVDKVHRCLWCRSGSEVGKWESKSKSMSITITSQTERHRIWKDRVMPKYWRCPCREYKAARSGSRVDSRKNNKFSAGGDPLGVFYGETDGVVDLDSNPCSCIVKWTGLGDCNHYDGLVKFVIFLSISLPTTFMLTALTHS